jgi:hypothetical protein
MSKPDAAALVAREIRRDQERKEDALRLMRGHRGESADRQAQRLRRSSVARQDMGDYGEDDAILDDI